MGDDVDALKERRTLGEEEGRMVSSVRGKLGSEKKSLWNSW